jgi:hypothetical protein
MEAISLDAILYPKDPLSIVYNRKGEIKVAFDDGRVMSLPDELGGLKVHEIPTKLNELANRGKISNDRNNYPEGKDEEEIDEGDYSSYYGDAITRICQVINDNDPLNTPLIVAQLSIDGSNSYNKAKYIQIIESMSQEEFTQYCHHLYKLQEFAVINTGSYLTDQLIIEQEKFKYLRRLKYPFDVHHIVINECINFHHYKSDIDPAAIVQACIDEDLRYNVVDFINRIETLTYNKFQEYCRHSFVLEHDVSVIANCLATNVGEPVPRIIKEDEKNFWEFEYPYGGDNEAAFY